MRMDYIIKREVSSDEFLRNMNKRVSQSLRVRSAHECFPFFSANPSSFLFDQNIQSIVTRQIDQVYNELVYFEYNRMKERMK